MKFSLRQLKFANEVCFSDTFKKLFVKHAKGTADAEFVDIHCFDLRHKCKGDLLEWVFNWSRADMDKGIGVIIDKILEELIGDYA